METEILIIGAGIAGISAYYKIKEAGKNVIILGEKRGATFLSSGAFDFPEEEIHIFHPLRNIQRNFSGYSDYLEFSKNSSLNFFNFLRKYGLNIDGCFEKKLILLNSLGSYKCSNFALKTIKDGDLNSLKDEKIIFVGISKFSEFNAEFIADSLNYLQSLEIIPSFKKISSFNIKITDSDIYLNPFYIAKKLEEDFESFIENLKNSLKGKDFTVAGFPAVLGIENSERIKEEIERKMQVKCFEILPNLPSVCGMRLKKIFEKITDKEKISARVVRIKTSGKNIDSVIVKDSTGEKEIKAKVYILATGKFTGGGILFNRRAKEVIFNLPLFYEDEKVDDKNIFYLSSEKIFENHKIFSLGVKTNEILQPVDENGEIIYRNLFACGSILSGYNCAEANAGTSIITGVFAGLKASEYV